MYNQGRTWARMFDWLYQSTDKNPVYLVKYETLKNDLVHEVERVLDFLSYPYKGLLIYTRTHTNTVRQSVPTNTTHMQLFIITKLQMVTD